MLTNQILTEAMEGIYQASGVPVAVYDLGTLEMIAVGSFDPAGRDEAVSLLADSRNESLVHENNLYEKVSDQGRPEYILITEGTGERSKLVSKMACGQLTGLLVAYRERFDRDTFIKNLLLDNMLLVDIYMRAGKLRIENNVPRVVLLVESRNDSDTNAAVMDVIRNLYPKKSRDYITAVDENNIILVKDLSEARQIDKAISEIAHTILDTLSGEVLGKVRIAYGSPVTDLKDISKSYKEARMAMEIGSIFYEERLIVDYHQLGIGRLIYQLPPSLCRMFLDETFKEVKLPEIDEETIHTVNKFFEKSLNVSETARNLYIHRNTLVYRLDKLQKNTGLDIRTFDDAITFKLALMVSKYMGFIEETGF